MTVEQLIARLHELVADPACEITMQTEVWHEHPDSGSPEVVHDVYTHPINEGSHYRPGPYRIVAMVSGAEPESESES